LAAIVILLLLSRVCECPVSFSHPPRLLPLPIPFPASSLPLPTTTQQQHRFSVQKRAEWKANNSFPARAEGPSMAKSVGELWKKLSDEEKRPYYEQADQDLEAWKRQMESFKLQHPEWVEQQKAKRRKKKRARSSDDESSSDDEAAAAQMMRHPQFAMATPQAALYHLQPSYPQLPFHNPQIVQHFQHPAQYAQQMGQPPQ